MKGKIQKGGDAYSSINDGVNNVKNFFSSLFNSSNSTNNAEQLQEGQPLQDEINEKENTYNEEKVNNMEKSQPPEQVMGGKKHKTTNKKNKSAKKLKPKKSTKKPKTKKSSKKLNK